MPDKIAITIPTHTGERKVAAIVEPMNTPEDLSLVDIMRVLQYRMREGSLKFMIVDPEVVNANTKLAEAIDKL